MPLLRFDIIEGRSDEELRKLLDAAHTAMIEAFDVPDTDRYQMVHQHKPAEMIIKDTGLGLVRTDNVVVISIVSKTRTQEKKQKLYRLMVEKLARECGLAQEDIMINIAENNDADWSFGNGEAQFLTGKL
ncbi:Tautomerase enzyme [Alteribacillus persepolensis]|uniref:Tautomerase enzyme n=1 Tax=Alteribacillus persepolensis TaxID=568899 RepID=A0A1G8F2F6_9BACI|nr:tautomerase family protein [Alteribacillus persepolensis]SDH76302.1 Tautomerase enzyme [Alteribacillus persepolensis]